MTAAVDYRTDLAATVLAGLGAAREQLQNQQPQVGRIGQQAREAFDKTRDRWVGLAAEAMPVPGHAATAAAQAMAEIVEKSAARGLASGMDLQLARGWAPAVAWQRALAGFGLDARAMRGYLANVIAVKAKRATAVVPEAARRRVQAALIALANTVAQECTDAARQCGRGPIAKDGFDPNQPRDTDGQWTAGGRGAAPGQQAQAKQPSKAKRQARVRERVRDDALQRMINAVPDDTEGSAGPHPYATPNNYATPNVYATPNNYATPNVYATPNKYAAPAPNRYAVAPNRYATKPRPIIRRLFIVFAGTKNPAGRPKTTTPPAGGQLYIPMADLAEYFNAGGKTANREGASATVDFDRLHTYHYDIHNVDQRIEVRHANDPVRSIDPALPEIDDDTWDSLSDMARPIWNAAHDKPMAFLPGLDDGDLAVVANWAGLGGPDAKPDAVARALHFDQKALANDGDLADASLVNAFADYVAWVRPDAAGSRGERLYDELREHYSEGDLDDPPIPDVMIFPHGLADGDDASDMHGRYKVSHVEYVSGIGEYGSGTRNGMIGAQLVYMIPENWVD